MAEKSAKSFLDLLKRSSLVPEDRLKKTLAALSKRAAGRKVNVDELTTHLIESGVITEWHYDKLINGKYKGFFLGKYKLLGHLGTGGMSSVYLAEHSITGKRRALKVLPKKKIADKSYLDRFYREGRAAASLNDPNVVRVYDICSEGDTHYMVMEFVKGRDLYEIVKEEGPLDFDLALDYIGQTAKGLAHAHERKLVHRDIKPANLLVTGKVVKILDLGLALLTEDEESLTVLHNEKVMGTADYLSPEQAVNSHEVDHRADIYSLGCTLYFLLTGHPPFPKGSLAQRIAMHQTKEPAEIIEDRPECPQFITALCKRMMKKDPAERYQTCEEIEHAVNLARQQLVANPVAQVAYASPDGNRVPLATPVGEVDSFKAGSGVASSRSAADIRTDEIASGITNTEPGQPSPLTLITEESQHQPNPVKKIPKLNVRKKKKDNAGLWFGIMFGLMFILLVLALFIATSFT